MNCINCGLPLDDGAVYCGNCGAPVAQSGMIPGAVVSHNVAYESNPAKALFDGIGRMGVNLGPLLAVVIITTIAAWAGSRLLTVVWQGTGWSTTTLEANSVQSVLRQVILALLAPLWLTLLLASARREQLAVRAVIIKSRNRFWLVVVAYLIMAVLLLLGLVALILPGLILAPVLVLVPYIVCEEGMGPIKAIRRSFSLVRGRWVEMYGLLSLGWLAIVLILIPFVGWIAVASIWLGLLVALAYRLLGLVALKNSAAPKLKPHLLNYVFIILGALLTVAGVLIIYSLSLVPISP